MTKKRIEYDHQRIEKKWQKQWLSDKVYSPDLNASRKPFYNLMMFPYPSAEGLHVGNMYAFTGADVFGRFQRMNGNDVFQPIGLDGFGIHSENYAIKVGRHPKEHAKISEEHYYNQLFSIGNGFAWEHRLETYSPDYYKWTQWLFIQMYNAGLAYKGSAMVNWCPSCKTVLADEQVEDGKCERCKNEVTRREMSSWFFKITKYADKLLENIEKINWPERIKIAQRQWIGKKEGALIQFKFSNNEKLLEAFTTRADTLFGATFIVIAPELAGELIDIVPEKNLSQVKDYINKALAKTEQDRKAQSAKTGVNTELYVKHPLTDENIPVFIADYVLKDVGTGVVMGVPAHDTRDFEFAKYQNLPIKQVIKSDKDSSDEVYEGENGVVINSFEFDGIDAKEAKKAIVEKLNKEGRGKTHTIYHLRDWLISRQRYWGPPIPMILCEKCGWQPVDESELPVKLPEIDDFKPRGDGTSPLSNAPEEWKNTYCPECNSPATRELDVSDTFLDSSWYFLAYPHIKDGKWSDDKPFSKEMLKTWLPVDAYIGGAEHAVLHLLYARFVTMVLHDLKILDFQEPFPFLFAHGLIIKDGAKMSKSRGNVVVPDEYINKFGADTLRTYLMFLGPYEGGGDFRDTGIEGMHRFLRRFWGLMNLKGVSINESDFLYLRALLHKTIKKVGSDLATFNYNTAISAIMEYINALRDKAKVKEKTTNIDPNWTSLVKPLVQILAPFAPHMCEEIWRNCLNEPKSIHISTWPKYDEKYLAQDILTLVILVDGKPRGELIIDKHNAHIEEQVTIESKKNEKVSSYLSSGIKNTIFVPGKLINFVTK